MWTLWGVLYSTELTCSAPEDSQTHQEYLGTPDLGAVESRRDIAAFAFHCEPCGVSFTLPSHSEKRKKHRGTSRGRSHRMSGSFLCLVRLRTLTVTRCECPASLLVLLLLSFYHVSHFLCLSNPEFVNIYKEYIAVSRLSIIHVHAYLGNAFYKALAMPTAPRCLLVVTLKYQRNLISSFSYQYLYVTTQS